MSFFSDKKTVDTTSNQSSSSSTGLSNQVKDYWSSIAGQYNPSTWSNVDPNAYQTDAANRTAGYASGLNPAFATANQIGGTGISTGDISRFQDPYTQQVVDATRANFAKTNAQQDAQTNANAAKLGALSGTQPLVARAITQGQRQPGQDATIAGLYDKGFQTALGAAGQSAGLQLQGLNSANAIAGQQAGINQQGFGQGTQLWNQDWQNRIMPYDIAGKGAQVLSSLSPQSGVTSTGSSTGTQTTTATPSPFSVATNVAGLAIGAAFPGMPLPSGGGKADGGRVEMAAGGTVGIKPRESDPHHRLTTAFDAVRGMLERARGGSVLPRFQDGGPAVGSSYSPGWNTTVTPASWTDNVDMKKLGSGLQEMGKPKNASGGGSDDGAGALRAQQQDLSSFMSRNSIRPGYKRGGEVDEYGGADGDLPSQVAGGGGADGDLPAPIAGGDGGRSVLPPGPVKTVEAGGKPLSPGAASALPSPISQGGASSDISPAGQPAEKSWMQRNLPGLTEGVFNGEKMTPGQRLGTALMSVRGPMFEGPTNGIARSIMEMDSSRQKDDQIKNQVDQFGQTKGLKEREVTLSENKSPAQIALLEAQAKAAKATEAKSPAEIALLEAQAKAAKTTEANKEREVTLSENKSPAEIALLQAQATAAKATAANKEREQLSSIAQKQILESEEVLANAATTKKFLDTALSLNDKAFSGWGANERAWAASNLPKLMQPDGTMETREMGRVMMQQVLGNLKSTFGAAPTEGERKILIDVEAAINATPEERAGVINRAKQILESRQVLHGRMLSELRGNTMFKPRDTSSAPSAKTPDPLGIR